MWHTQNRVVELFASEKNQPTGQRVRYLRILLATKYQRARERNLLAQPD